MHMNTSRRNFLRISAAGLAAAQAPALFANSPAPLLPSAANKIPFELGIASYTFREFSLEEVIAMSQGLQIKNLCLKSMHLPLDLSPAEIDGEVAKINDGGLNLYGGGVIYMKSKEEVDQAFAYAKQAGMKVIVGVPQHELLKYCNQHVKKSGIQLAIHNHGPGDDLYPTPESAYKLIHKMDPGMGLCVDIGHTRRIGDDPTEQTAALFDRVLDIHIKDEDKAAPEGKTCEIGHGVIDIPRFLEMLLEKKYNRIVSFEYEKDGKNPLPGLAESVGYVRGVLKMLS